MPYPTTIKTLGDLKSLLARYEAAGLADDTEILHDCRQYDTDGDLIGDEPNSWFSTPIFGVVEDDGPGAPAFITIDHGNTPCAYLDLPDSMPIRDAYKHVTGKEPNW